MAPFICKCENKSYAGWFNKKKCKDCNTIIHNRYGTQIGGYAWKTQKIKDLKKEVKDLKKELKDMTEFKDYLRRELLLRDGVI